MVSLFVSRMRPRPGLTPRSSNLNSRPRREGSGIRLSWWCSDGRRGGTSVASDSPSIDAWPLAITGSDPEQTLNTADCAADYLEKARKMFPEAIRRRPRITVTIRQRTRVVDQYRKYCEGLRPFECVAARVPTAREGAANPWPKAPPSGIIDPNLGNLSAETTPMTHPGSSVAEVG